MKKLQDFTVIKESNDAIVIDDGKILIANNTGNIEKIIELKKINENVKDLFFEKIDYLNHINRELKKSEKKTKFYKKMVISSSILLFILALFKVLPILSIVNLVALVFNTVTYVNEKVNLGSLEEIYDMSYKKFFALSKIATIGDELENNLINDDVEIENLDRQIIKVDMKGEYKRLRELLISYDLEEISEDELIRLFYKSDVEPERVSVLEKVI